MEQFRKLGIREHLLKAIAEEKFEIPSEIQEKTIPYVLAGKDVIAKASTGSGKTLAFASVIVHDCVKGQGIQALILTPTRELAEQNTQAIKKFSKHNPLNIISVYGGVSIVPQIEEVYKADVVIGTPGRVLDHISRRTINLSKVKILVLDEADRMLDMGFRDDVEQIINECPKKRQTLLFSATMYADIVMLAQKYMHNPIEVSAEQYVDPTKMTQIYYDVQDGMKFSLLVHLLKSEDAKLVMVFCNTRSNVDFVANNLIANGIDALPIHGGFTQDKRNRVLEKFNSNKVKIMVCTDVAARGLDIKGVSHVYNYDIPKESKEYLHRIGRTARAGKEGKVINIITNRDYENFSNVERDNPEVDIKNEKTPFIDRVRIGWMPEKRERYGRDREGGDERERRPGRNFSRDNSSRGRNEGNSRFGRNNGRSGGSNRPSRTNSSGRSGFRR